MKYLMFYETTADRLPAAGANFPAHRARLDEFHRRGVLVMAGPYGEPTGGAVGVFTSREAAEEFIAGDPFILHGVVTRWSVEPWNEVLS